MRWLIGTLIVVGLVWAALELSRPADSDTEGGLTVSGVLGGSEIEGFARATEVRDFEFPRDHGPHPEYRTEWWYVTGNLRDAEGNRFGLQWTLFRSALAPDTVRAESEWATNQAYMAHFALTDVARGAFMARERFARGAQGLAGARSEPFRVWLEDWELASVDPAAMPSGTEGSIFPLRLTAADGERSLSLTLVPEKSPVFQGDRGLSQKAEGEGNASYYYSYTRLRAEGRIRVGERTHEVRGSAWLDREWSTSVLAEDQVGWDWFALQLEDGRDLMYYQLRRPDGSAHEYSEGVLVESDGTVTRLSGGDVELEVTDRWRSPDSGIEYPSGWRLRLPSRGLDLGIRPVLDDQELELTFRYWEGAVDVTGRGGSAETSGVGYVEMTGYGPEDAGGRTEIR